MTEIKIVRLTLENFKCHRHLQLDFSGRNATIYGDNATGKTSIYDALTWLLFGKDSQGNGEKMLRSSRWTAPALWRTIKPSPLWRRNWWRAGKLSS